MNKISAVYKIVNTVTGDFYVGSSKDVMRRWLQHKQPSVWKKCPNNPMYQDMQKYGLEKFRFQILAPVMPEYLTQVEQEFIDMLHPSYNSQNANGLNIERHKEIKRRYRQSDKGKVVSEETRNRIKKSLEGRVFTSTKVVCIETGEVYESATCASLHLGLGPSAVRKSIVRNGACAGFHWKYLEVTA